jgi:nuclease-related domain protein
MAKMIPDIPREFDPKSQEGLMFEELNNLPENYYVFHSFSIVTVDGTVVKESETDFVIFHPKKGILCLEAKAGQIDYVDGYWKYGSGKKMQKDGPYNQASSNKWKLKDYMINHGLNYEFEHCKLMHAVWFPNVPLSKFQGKQLPSEADLKITLTADSFGKIEEDIEKIFSLEIPAKVETNLSDKDVKRILERVLAPSFSLISLQEVEIERTKNVFKRMLKEQIALLNYLEEQNNAIINGLAGTGKTVMAVEKARLHSEKGENVLFLCYNSFLKEHLKNTYPYPHVHYYTIDGLACKICNTKKPDYNLLKESLEEMFVENRFPYKHVIIDEGQDFGKIEIEEEELIELLKVNAIGNEERNGTFYLFYDKNQMIQSSKVPKYIEDADCKLTLYRNCRNTENIALTSLRLLGTNKSPKLYKDAVLGDIPEIGFALTTDTTVELLNSQIDKYINAGYTSITVLTCNTEESSIIADYCKDSKYNYKRGYIKFTTCRKFKGLESDVVIVVDIDKTTFDGSRGEQLMYVGTSRAKYKLSCIVNMSEDDCLALMEKKGIKYNRNILKSFVTAFNAKVLQKKD